MKKKDEPVLQELDHLKKSYPNNEKSNGNELMQFFIGVILLGVGLFLLTKRVVVSGGWYTWYIGGLGMSSGLVVIPLIIGIIWYFCNSNSNVPKIIITLGAIFIVVTIIMSIRIHFVATSMFDYILIIGMIAAGSGLLLKTLFKRK